MLLFVAPCRTPSPSSSFTPWRIATQVVVPASSPLRRAMSRVSSPNTSGLPPQESKKLPERQAELSEQKIISALKEVIISQSSEAPTLTLYLPTSLALLLQTSRGNWISYLRYSWKLTFSWSKSTYEVYNKDAVFQDPVGIATGADSIASQFNALVKVVMIILWRFLGADDIELLHLYSQFKNTFSYSPVRT